jgi:hypothetical protein
MKLELSANMTVATSLNAPAWDSNVKTIKFEKEKKSPACTGEFLRTQASRGAFFSGSCLRVWLSKHSRSVVQADIYPGSLRAKLTKKILGLRSNQFPLRQVTSSCIVSSVNS